MWIEAVGPKTAYIAPGIPGRTDSSRVSTPRSFAPRGSDRQRELVLHDNALRAHASAIMTSGCRDLSPVKQIIIHPLRAYASFCCGSCGSL